jgi:hypothetical protein
MNSDSILAFAPPALSAQTEVQPPEPSFDRDALALNVIEGFKTACAKLAEIKPLIEQLWHEFDNLEPGEKILGCGTKKAFCKQYLNRSPRAIQYLLYGRQVSNVRALGAVADKGSEQRSPSVREEAETGPTEMDTSPVRDLFTEVLNLLNACLEHLPPELRNQAETLIPRVKEHQVPLLEQALEAADSCKKPASTAYGKQVALFSEGLSFPCEYEGRFLDSAKADALLECLDRIDFPQRANPRNPTQNLRRQTFEFVDDGLDLNTEAKGEYSFGHSAIRKALIKDAPAEIQDLRNRLSSRADKTINYLSVNKYPDGNAGIGWHRHQEDLERDADVWIISVGLERKFWIRERNKPETAVFRQAKHGTLITMPSILNETHEHAILREARVHGTRYSVVAKCMPPLREVLPVRSEGPRVFDCHAGKEYPADAVYVGCRTIDRSGNVIREGTIWGNAVDPFQVRNKHSNPWIAEDEAGFRKYAESRMHDHTFRNVTEQLRGKDLLCWCAQSGKNRADFCHARVWLDLANRTEAVPMKTKGARAGVDCPLTRRMEIVQMGIPNDKQ